MHADPNPKHTPSRCKTVLSVFGSRPEAIKMAPVLSELKALHGIQTRVCFTGQDRDMLEQTLGLFGVDTDYDLEIVRDNSSLFDTTTESLPALREVMLDAKPDMVMVHGDTTTALSAALAAFYLRVPVAHVEAGLRSFDKWSTWPDEFNRRTIDTIADLHFAPTARARQNLLAEKTPDGSIFVTGNTSVDAAHTIAARQDDFPMLRQRFNNRPLVLLSVHRRENFGRPMEKIFTTVRTWARQNPGCSVIFPVHPNPNITRSARDILGELRNVSLIPPVDYTQSIFLLRNCQFVMTDSGGLQEEAPAFGKPVVILRDTTERPESIENGSAIMTGSDPEKIMTVMTALSNAHSDSYRRMAAAGNPFGDGRAAHRIASVVLRSLAPALVESRRVL